MTDEAFKTAVRAVFPEIKFIDCHTDEWDIVMTYELCRNLPFNSNKRIRFYRDRTGKSFIEFSCYRASSPKTMKALIPMIRNSGWVPCEKDYEFRPMSSPVPVPDGRQYSLDLHVHPVQVPPKQQPITLEQYRSVCSRFFPGTPITETPVTGICDCKPCKSLWVRFYPEDKYTDSRVHIFGEDWSIHAYTETELASELETIVSTDSIKQNLKGTQE